MRAATSDTENKAIREGICVGVRGDGRALEQARTPTIVCGAIPHSDGSAHVDLDGTQVVCSVNCNVLETRDGRGKLRIFLDALPSVVSIYGTMISGTAPCGRSQFLAFISQNLCAAFGASAYVAQETGTVEAVTEEQNDEVPALLSTFPGEQLSLTHNFAFVLDVDVHLLQCHGGNILGAASLAVRAALTSTRPPAVTLHETAAGIAVELDRSSSFQHPISWKSLPIISFLRLSDSSYVVDPTLPEEAALPQWAIVAAAGPEAVSYFTFGSFPSQKGPARMYSRCDMEALVADGIVYCHRLIHAAFSDISE